MATDVLNELPSSSVSPIEMLVVLRNEDRLFICEFVKSAFAATRNRLGAAYSRAYIKLRDPFSYECRYQSDAMQVHQAII